MSYNYYEYYPSLAGNAILAAVMGLALVTHVAQMVYYRAWWFGISFILGTACEFIGYVTRTLSHDDVTLRGPYIAQIVTLVFAPVFIMAGIYYLLAILIVVYGRQFSWINPGLCSWIFILGDVVSLFVQAGGGGIAAGSDANADLGQNVMLAGIAFQVLIMVVFSGFFAVFLHRIRFMRDQSGVQFNEHTLRLRQSAVFRYYPIPMIAALILVFVRSIFRLVEFTASKGQPVLKHEAYFMILDALMMALAILTFNILHPGRIVGRDVTVKRLKTQPGSDDEKATLEASETAF